jgi:tryptophanyl-tRNA synthetase
MSKSANSGAGVVWLLDEPSVTAKKIRSAVTDAGREVRFDQVEKAGVSNLLSIFSVLTDRTVDSLEADYDGRGYGDFKKDLADAVVETFAPIRERTLELLADPAELDRALALNADRAAEIANATLATVYDRVGLLPRR